MADLENLLLEAAGRTGTTKKPLPPRQPLKRGHDGSSSDDGSDSKYDDDSDDEPSDFASRKPPGPQIPLKKRLDSVDKEEDSDISHGDINDDDDGDDDGDNEVNHYQGDGFDDDDSESIGEDLYKDDADREALAKMSELERESILYERAAKLDDNKLKQKVRASSAAQQHDKKAAQSSFRKESPRRPSLSSRLSAKSTKPGAKSDALNELRAKRTMKQLDSEGYRAHANDATTNWSSDIGGDDSRPPKEKPDTPESDSSESDSESGDEDGAEGSPDDVMLPDSDEDIIDSSKPTFEDIREITVRRSKLAKWFMEPFFEELIVGCFVRIGIGLSRTGESIYRLCLVQNVDASEPDRQYKLESRTTYKYLNCVWGNESSAARWQMARVSDSPPTLKEFEEWVREVEKCGGRMVEKQDILDRKEAIQKVSNTSVYPAETVKQTLHEKKSTSNRPMNVAAEKDRLRRELELAEIRHDEAEAERIRTRLRGLEVSRRLHDDKKAARLAEMNRKNREENFKNASVAKSVSTSLKAGDAGYDPFSRRWTSLRNYYSSASVVSNETTNANDGSVAVNGSAEVESLAGEAATVAALEAAADAGKLIDTKAPVDRGTELNLLHDFELPISLAVLQKFGGPVGFRAALIARKQRIEATVGVKVSEIESKRHAPVLTVEEYKRRRGLL